MVRLAVAVSFGSRAREGSVAQELEVDVQPGDSVLALKQKVAAAAGGRVTADDLLLTFPANDRKIGRQYRGDPTVDEAALTLEQYSVLAWVERFPHWRLTARLLPATPPPPGVAIQKAAATAEKKDPERAVADARAKGAIPKISDLPAPWGDEPYTAPEPEQLTSWGYLPARYPEGWTPLADTDAAAA